MPATDRDTPSCSPGVRITPLLWCALGLAGAHLILVLLMGNSAQPSTMSFLRALISCVILPLPGLAPAILLLGRSPSKKDAACGAYTLVILSLGFALLIHYATVVVLRLAAPPVTAIQLSLSTLGWTALALIAGGWQERMRVRAEPGLSGRALGLALVVAAGFALFAQHRLFSGLTRFLQLPPEQVEEVDVTENIITPSRARLAWVSGMQPKGGHRFQAQKPSIFFKMENVRGDTQILRIFLALTAPLESRFELWHAPARRCGLPPRPALKVGRRLASASVPANVLSIPLQGVVERTSTTLLARFELVEEAECFELRLISPVADDPQQVEVIDISHEDLSGWIANSGRLFFLTPGGAECHFSDAWYRHHMLTSNRIKPELLLWGYFPQFVAEVLAGGSYPMLGLFFLLLALLCFAGTLVIIGAIAGQAAAGEKAGSPGELSSSQPIPGTLAAGLLLLGPFYSHLHNMVQHPTQYFAFPDAPYSAFLVAALAMLLRRNRAGFILMGCLAAYARYPGAYVMAVALIAWWFIHKEDRRWTLHTLLWSVLAGVVVLGLLLLHFATGEGVKYFLQGVYFEIFPEHFAVYRQEVSLGLRSLLFTTKLASLSCLTLVLWPLGWRQPGARLIMVVVLAYALTLMSVQIPHDHYFQFLLYGAAAAGLSALSSDRQPKAKLVAAVILVLVGLLCSVYVTEFTAAGLGLEEINYH